MTSVNMSGNSLSDGFFGAYEKRVQENSLKNFYEQAVKENRVKDFSDPNTEKVLWNQISDSEVNFSAQAQNYISEMRQNKAAILAENSRKEETEEPANVNPFSKTSGTNLYPQFLVFSEYLYQNGFYDSMSDQEVKTKEDLLKDIVSPMDNFGCDLKEKTLTLSNGETVQVQSCDHDKALTADGAEVAFQSSIKALQYYAEKLIPDGLREGFNRLIDEYASHNRSRVDNYVSFRTARDKNAADDAPPEFRPKTQEDRDRYAQYAADKKLANVEHTEEEKMKHDLECRTWLSMLSGLQTDPRSVFANLKKSMIQYASGYSGDQNVLNRTSEKLNQGFSIMENYWNRLLREKA